MLPDVKLRAYKPGSADPKGENGLKFRIYRYKGDTIKNLQNITAV